MSIEPMLVLSTSHLPKAMMDALERLAAEEVHLTRSIPHMYGVIIYAHADLREETAPEINAVIEHARKLGCDWINFDRDADTIDGLPTWEWR